MGFQVNFGFVATSAGDRPALPLLKQQFSISELIALRGETQNHLVDSEDTGLQDHSEENCLYCVGASVLGYPAQPQINSTHSRTGGGGEGVQTRPSCRFSPFSVGVECQKWSLCFIFTPRLRRLPLLERSGGPSSGGDASVEVLWCVGLQRCCCVTGVHL